MNPKTLAALEGSIAKWEAIVKGTGEDLGSVNCPLCNRFNPDYFMPMCEVEHEPCPVKAATGEMFCVGSPYDTWTRRVRDGYTRCATTPELVELAQAELDFLKSLLPKGQP